MALFKSKEERRMERTIQTRQAAAQIRRQIKANEKYETEYIEKAKRARKLGWTTQYEFLKKAIKKTATVRLTLERQLLALESAIQMKEQAEGHLDFAKAMNAISSSISEAFGSADLAKTQVNFEKAMAQASTMEQRIETFLDMTSETMFESESGANNELVKDSDIEKMLSGEVEHEERAGLDDIERDLNSIEKEIGKLSK